MILTRLCNLIGEMVNLKFFSCSDVRLANKKEADILIHLYKCKFAFVIKVCMYNS